MKKAFISIESLLYFLLLYGDFTGSYDTAWIKYLGILLCFAYAWTNGVSMISIAFSFTIIADWFLVFYADKALPGVAVFCLTQLAYAVFLWKEKRGFVILRLAAVLAVWAALLLLKQSDVLLYLVSFYFINLLLNAIQAFALRKTFIGIGLTLFILCDICVGMCNADMVGLSFKLRYFFLGMWFFYLPSQVILSLCSERKSK